MRVPPHVHTNSRPTRIISPFLGSPPMQGLAPAHNRHPRPAHRHYVEVAKMADAPEQLKHSLSPARHADGAQSCQSSASPQRCQPDNTRPVAMATQGYVGLQTSPRQPPRCNKMRQNATGQHVARGATQSPDPGQRRRNYRTNCRLRFPPTPRTLGFLSSLRPLCYSAQGGPVPQSTTLPGRD